MNRYIMGNQIMGYAFVKLLEMNKHKIDLIKISEIQREVAKSIREENNAILDFTERDLYEMQQDYDDIFELNDEYMEISDYIIYEIERNVSERKMFMYKLNRYFTSGIPIDISYTVEQVLKRLLEG